MQIFSKSLYNADPPVGLGQSLPFYQAPGDADATSAMHTLPRERLGFYLLPSTILLTDSHTWALSTGKLSYNYLYKEWDVL